MELGEWYIFWSGHQNGKSEGKKRLNQHDNLLSFWMKRKGWFWIWMNYFIGLKWKGFLHLLVTFTIYFLLLLLNAMPIFNCKVPFQNFFKSFVLKMPERFWKISTPICSLAKNIHHTLLSLVITFSPTLTLVFGTLTIIIIIIIIINHNIITQLCLEGLGTSPRSAMTNLFNSLGFCFTSHSLALI